MPRLPILDGNDKINPDHIPVHGHVSAEVSDLPEAVQDLIGAYIAAGANMTSTYDDATGVTTLSVVAPGEWTNTDPEIVRDVIGGALVGAANITVAVNDAGDTITISTTATANSTDEQLRDRTTHTGVTPDSGLPSRLAQADLDARYAPVSVITLKAVEALPDDYPSGVTVMAVENSAGWPLTYGTVETYKASSTRTTQRFVSQVGGRTFVRVESGNIWSSWVEAADGTDSGWVEVGSAGAPSFQGAWVNFDALQTAAYRKIGNRVQLRGMIKSGTLNTTAFILPVGFRVSGAGGGRQFPVVSNDAFGSVNVEPAGQIIPKIGNVSWFNLSSISFLVD